MKITNSHKLGLDFIMITALLIIMVPIILGRTIHEWAGLLIGIAFLYHIYINWKWIKKVTTSFHRRLPGKVRFKYIINLLLFIGFTAIVISGIYISKTIDFTWLGIDGGSRASWKIIHSTSAYIALAIAGIHTGLNFSWVLRTAAQNISPGVLSIRYNQKVFNVMLVAGIFASGLYSFYYVDYILPPG